MADQIAEAVASMIPPQSFPEITFSLLWGGVQLTLKPSTAPTIVVGDMEEDE